MLGSRGRNPGQMSRVPPSCPSRAAATRRSVSARNGSSMSMNNVLNREILPTLKAAGIPWKGWHAFRRGLATNLHALGVDELTIQRILRHSNVAVTQKCYIKTLPEQSVAGMRRLEAALNEVSRVQ